MGLPPGPHPSNVFRPAEMVLVPGFGQPAELTGHMTRLLTGILATVALAITTARTDLI
jgi:hypothetical protein